MSVATSDSVRRAILADARKGLSVRAIAVKHRIGKSTAADIIKAGDSDTRTEGEAKGKGEPKTGDNAASSPIPRARAADRTPLVEALGPELRRDLRRGVSGIARFIAQAGERVGVDGKPIANPDAPVDSDGFPDWQQVAHAARALDILVARVPDLMTFDETTAAKQEADAASDAVSDKLRSAIQRKHARPPATTLTLVESITKAG